MRRSTGGSAASAEPVPAGPIPRRERIVFAVGDCFGGGGSAVIGVLYLFFLTDIVGLNPALAGLTILVAKIWDAVSHPIMGVISDNTRSRWGRRRPWILLGALLLPLAQALLWAPVRDLSTGWKLGFVLTGHLVYSTIASIVAVPYGSMTAEISVDHDERNRINVLRLAVVALAGAGSTLVVSWLLDVYKDGDLAVSSLYLVLVVGFGLFFAVPLVAVARFTHERAPIPVERTTFSVRAMTAPLQVPAFRSLLALYVCPALTLDIVSALAIYYSLYVVPGVDNVGFMASFIVVTLVMFPVVHRLVQRVDKSRIYYTLIPVGLVAVLGIGFYPPDGAPVGVYLLVLALGFGLVGSQMMTWIMFPDVVDAGELQQGARNAGSFAGLLVLVRAAASALAIQMLSLMLDVTGYQPPPLGSDVMTQPSSAVWGIRLSMAVGVVVLMGVGYVVARRYPLSRQVCSTMQDELARVRAERGAVGPERHATRS